MKKTTENLALEILKRNDLLYLKDQFIKAVEESIKRIKKGGKLVICGNGGSCSDSSHIVGELMKGFVLPRRLNKADKDKFNCFGETGKHIADNLQYGIPAVALSGTDAISTAVANDNGAEMVYAQQTFSLLTKNDIFIGISTSGNAENVTLAMMCAKTIGAFSIALTGKGGGKMKELADANLIVDNKVTYQIQEKHLPLYHAYCICIENEFYGE